MASKRMNKKKKRSGRARPINALIVLCALVLNIFIALGILTPTRYDVVVGSPAKQTITAPRQVEDVVTTEALRQAARNSVSTVYTHDEKLAASTLTALNRFFDELEQFRQSADAIRNEGVTPLNSGDSIPTPNADTTDDAVSNEPSTTPQTDLPQEDTRAWTTVISESVMATMLQRFPVVISDTSLGYAMLNATEDEILRLKETVTAKIQVKLEDGFSEKELESIRSGVSRELQITTIPTLLKNVGEILLDNYLVPTNVADSAATAAAQEKAASAVSVKYIARGAVIVEAGQYVTADQMTVLTSLNLVRGINENKWFPVGVILYLSAIYGIFIAYLHLFEPEVYGNRKMMFLLLLILGITILLQWLCNLLDPRIVPVMFAVLLSVSLISRSIAQAVNVLMALSAALLAGGSGTSVLGSDSMLTLCALLTSGQVAIFIAAGSEKRGALITAGTVGGAVGAGVILAGTIILNATLTTALIFAGCILFGSLILSVFCVGMMSVWENLFDIVTPARLHELMNANHPLLRRMMNVAPGTYHHSIMTASLAEGAAEAIGANALLARVGAMYHDVGKLRRPQYFKENQTDRNIHDTLPPEESAAYIIAHQKDAEPMLNRYKMPSAIRRIAYEHHGTTLVAYFYFKARKEAENPDSVSEKKYRYPGTPPTTRESAVVMLSDSCEAAVRSLSDPTREDIAQMVHKIVQGKLEDGQLNQCPLTLSDISRIERSFLVTFNGLLHERIRYPEEEDEDDGDQ